MANEITLAYITGDTLYAVIRSATGQYYNTVTPGFETFTAANWVHYAIALTEITSSNGQYQASFPSLAAGVYVVGIYLQAGGSPASSDGPPIATGQMQWTGTAEVATYGLPQSAAGTSGGLPTLGTGAGQINPDGTGAVPIAFGTALPAAPSANSVGEALYVADIGGGRAGTAQGGTSTTLTLDAGASTDANAYIGDGLFLTGGTGGGPRGTGQRRTIVAYNTTTKVATVDRAWHTTPDSTTTFMTLPAPKSDVYLWQSGQVPAPSQAGVPITDPHYTGGTVLAGAPGYMGVDWGALHGAATTVNLSGTTVAAVSGALAHYDDGFGRLYSHPLVGNIDGITGVTFPPNFGVLAIAATTGQVGLDWSNIKAPTTTVNLSGTTVGTVTTTTTATNLTNAPTAGDFTAAMKTSLNAATPAAVTGAVGSVTGNVGGNVGGDIAGKVLGGGSSAITGVGARAVDGSGNALATHTDATTIESAVAAIPTNPLTSLGSTAPAGWINAAAVAAAALNGKGDWATHTDATSILTAVGSPMQAGASVTVATNNDKTGYSLNLGQAGLTPRNLGSVADGSLTVGDALVCAIAAAAGKETVGGTTYTVMTPSTGTVIRTFTLDQNPNPSSRT